MSSILKDFRDNVSSQETYIELIMERVYIPMMDMACECSDGLANATFSCIRNYDAEVVQQIGQGTYQMVVGMLDLESMEQVMVGALAMHCNEVGGEACYQDFADQMRTHAKMMDKTMRGAKSNDCSAFSRVDKEMKAFVQELSEDEPDMSAVIRSYSKMNKKGMCSKKCSNEMADTFYSCCSVEAMDLEKEHKVGKNIGNIIDNVWGLLSTFSAEMGDAPITKEDIRVYMATMDPATMCGKKKGSVFRNQREECEEERDEYNYKYGM